jgi:AraC-like DNA-binding protein/mannose-6-phosphate isomerase-like protein (cupin superfamily)
MSRNSQTIRHRPRVDSSLPPQLDYNCPRVIVASAQKFHAALETPPHSHPRGQLIYAESGTLTTTAATGAWVAPPNRAIWIPAGESHVTRCTVNTEIRSIYVAKNALPELPTHCAVVQINPLLRELILAVVRLPGLYDEDGADGRLVRVLLDRVAALPHEPLHLPMPKSARLRAIATDLAENPGPSLAGAAHSAAMSPRSFARHFLVETGFTFGTWQRQARLLRALELLGTGKSVGDVAFNLGYESTSAFIAMFRRSFGVTPARYFEGPE